MGRKGLRAALCVLAATAAVMRGQAPAEATAAVPAGHHIKTVFIILMENHNWSGDGGKDIMGNPRAPYINDTLVPMSSYANQYYNPPHNHPSAELSLARGRYQFWHPQ